MRSILPSLPVTTTQPFSTFTRLTVFIDRLINVPSFVSITKRGPASGSGAGSGGGVGFVVRAVEVEGVLRRVVELRGVGFGLAGSSVSSVFGSADFASVLFSTTGSDVLGCEGVGLDVRLGGVLVRGLFLVVVGRVVSGVVITVSTGVAEGVGSGVGAVATSVTGGSGSGKRAPTEETRRVFPPPVVAVSGAALSDGPISGPPITGSKDPPKKI